MALYRMPNWNYPVRVAWCLHCERIQRVNEDASECAFTDCDGHSGDLWFWVQSGDYAQAGWPPSHWPKYPPRNGVRLPLYE